MDHNGHLTSAHKSAQLKTKGNLPKIKKNKVTFRRGTEESLFPVITIKPVQGKKTIEIFHQRSKNIRNKHVLNIMISQNFKSQADQLTERLNKQEFDPEIDQFCLDNEWKPIFVLHGNKDNSKEWRTYLYSIVNEGKRDIISLCNPTRLKVLGRICIEWIKIDSRNKVNIQLDEADKTFKPLDKYVISEVGVDHIRDCRMNIHFITASAENLIEQIKKIYNGFKICERTSDLENYISITSIPWHHREWKTYEDVLLDYVENLELIQNDDYIFWPLNFIVDSQKQACSDIIDQIDCTIVLINGDGHRIYTKNHEGEIIGGADGILWPKKICSKKQHCGFPTCEKCKPITAKNQIKLLEHIKEKYALNKALILSGNLCCGRAMTFHYGGLPFTKTFYTDEIKEGCFGKNKSTADIYQLICRILGSFKNELNGNYPIAYGNEEFRNIALREETAAIKLSSLPEDSIVDGKGMNDIYNGNEFIPKSLEESLGVVLEIYKYEINFKVDDSIEDIKSKIENFNKKLSVPKYREETLRRVMEGFVHKNINIQGIDNISKWIVSFEKGRKIFDWKNEQFQITLSEKDGDCLFHSIINSEQIPEQDIKQGIKQIRAKCVKTYFQNSEEYNNYLTDDYASDLCQVIEDIKNNGVWNTEIHDLMPHLLSSLYNLKLNIFNFECNSENIYVIKDILNFPHVVEPINGTNPGTKTINLFHTQENDSLHYDFMKVIETRSERNDLTHEWKDGITDPGDPRITWLDDNDCNEDTINTKFPEIMNSTIQFENGYWTTKTQDTVPKRKPLFNDHPGGGGTHVTINYKSKDSKLFTVRTNIKKKNQ